ncbi:MAG: type I phosphomannose isomerase catalytic subunit [Planctomycetota bacterium]
MSDLNYPLVFERRLLEKVWGANRLEGFLIEPRATAKKIGETWEVSDYPQKESIVMNGPLAGKTLRELMISGGRDLMGAAALPPTGRFPLLVKFIDTSDRLSVQVHPSDLDAKKLNESDGGKSEAWYIIDAAENAQLWVGLAPGVSEREFKNAKTPEDYLRCMREVRPRAGDAIAIPAGTLHAIGAGVTVCEIQQTSDITYRVYDWGRPETPERPLHPKQSSEVLKLHLAPSIVHTKGAEESAEALPSPGVFNWSIHRSAKSQTIETNGRFRIIVGIHGFGKLYSLQNLNESIQMKPGVVALVPASVNNCMIEPIGEMQWIHVDPAAQAAN